MERKIIEIVTGDKGWIDKLTVTDTGVCILLDVNNTLTAGEAASIALDYGQARSLGQKLLDAGAMPGDECLDPDDGAGSGCEASYQGPTAPACDAGTVSMPADEFRAMLRLMERIKTDFDDMIRYIRSECGAGLDGGRASYTLGVASERMGNMRESWSAEFDETMTRWYDYLR